MTGYGTLRKVSATQQLRQLSWGTADMLSGCTRCPPLRYHTAKTHICHDASWLRRSIYSGIQANARLTEGLEHVGMAVI